MKRIFILSLVASITLVTGCKKNDIGGDASLGITAKHHGSTIPGTWVYIKYGAKDFPGEDVSKYDASFLADGSGYALIEGLRYGDYYLYGVGYDSSLAQTVKGGTPIIIKWGSRKELQKEDLSITE
jgi:hypothetical protein